MSAHIEPLLSTDETAAIFGITRGRLEAWQIAGRGPRFVKWGKAIRYDRKDVNDWIEAQNVSSTSEYSAKAA